jgi:hypothetical protein
MLTLPGLLLWFNFFGLPVPPLRIDRTGWLADSGPVFQPSLTLHRWLTIVVAAYFVVRAVSTPRTEIDLWRLYSRRCSSRDTDDSALISNLQTATRFSAVDVLD